MKMEAQRELIFTAKCNLNAGKGQMRQCADSCGPVEVHTFPQARRRDRTVACADRAQRWTVFEGLAG